MSAWIVPPALALAGVLTLPAPSVLAQPAGRAPLPEPVAPVVLEAYPERIRVSLAAYERSVSSAAERAGRRLGDLPQYVIVEQTRRWMPGQTVRVAFHGGDEALWARVEAAAQPWVGASGANLRLSFRDAAGRYRRWSPTDVAYAGEIRVAFASGRVDGGHWSHLGRTSVNAAVEGGRPNQASMNLDMLAMGWPVDGEAVVAHEFGHALGFEHEHQNPRGGCDFRFHDDPGYVLTLRRGVAVPDAQGRRPGLYSSLGHAPNQWSRAEVDFNLGAIPDSRAYAVSAFDPWSIMKYRFDADMFVHGEQSVCRVDRHALRRVSDQDLAGAQLAYPVESQALAASHARMRRVMAALSAPWEAPAAVAGPARRQLEVLGGDR